MAIKKKQEMTADELKEMREDEVKSVDAEIWDLIKELEENAQQREILMARFTAKVLREASLMVEISVLEAEIEAREATIEDFEDRLDRDVCREALREAWEGGYKRCAHECAQAKRERKQAELKGRGKSPRKKQRKKTRENCRRAARAERDGLRSEFADMMAEIGE